MKLTAIEDNIILKTVPKQEDIVEGGILIPGMYRGESFEREVHSAGEKVTTVKAGDRVLVSKYEGTTVDVEGEEMLFVKPKDLLAIV
jgi:chaperonin GroES